MSFEALPQPNFQGGPATLMADLDIHGTQYEKGCLRMRLRLVSREKLEVGGLFELIVPKDVCLEVAR